MTILIHYGELRIRFWFTYYRIISTQTIAYKLTKTTTKMPNTELFDIA